MDTPQLKFDRRLEAVGNTRPDNPGIEIDIGMNGRCTQIHIGIDIQEYLFDIDVDAPVFIDPVIGAGL